MLQAAAMLGGGRTCWSMINNLNVPRREKASSSAVRNLSSITLLLQRVKSNTTFKTVITSNNKKVFA
jgi:hypothetical protein